MLKVGIIQQHNSANTQDNMQRLRERIAEVAKQGAELVVLQELHNSLYFCQVEEVDTFDLGESIPGPSTYFLGKWQESTTLCWWYRYLKSELQASTTTRQ